MKIEKLAELEKQMMEEVVRRRKLGGYSMEAEGILLIGEALLKVITHILDESPVAVTAPAPFEDSISEENKTGNKQ